jgi:hypothetical protein
MAEEPPSTLSPNIQGPERYVRVTAGCDGPVLTKERALHQTTGRTRRRSRSKVRAI